MVKIMTTELTIKKVCPGFDEWPSSWVMGSGDKEYGRNLLEVFTPFCQYLIDSGQARKTVRNHMNNLWLLGGELIEQINEDEDKRRMPAAQLVRANVDEDGGPYSRHLNDEAEMRSFDATCRKFHKFLNIDG